ncbi:4-alpha-glucanotransferase [Acetobacterium tundrae]|uniref:4-alpha-glucanotransferase n=1 Tax=Acetobacterium tundrae TaxID=132932 RepID=A0ABR6WGF5_9FIRM|nr:4-alpha-glucanotransferase [Acetobacterium tundrae]MBC3795571.1 4-alpha-glucanotransferase [Acetobacterium tundrae]
MQLTKRSSGVLMHISSLPGDYGIGTLGLEAQNFIDLLVSMNFTYWQILPTGPVDDYFSPYKSISAFAGNPLLIDLDILFQWDLLSKDELSSCQSFDSPYSINYSTLIKNRKTIFKLAFSRLTHKQNERIRNYCEANSEWLPDFSLYSALSDFFSENDWTKWIDTNLVHRNPSALSSARAKLAEEINYHNFLQYAYDKQWRDLKNYANSKGIKIIGDLPIYVAHTSSDVWSHPELFQLNNKGYPLEVAGVPPDYFSENGQLWGNPLYRWDVMKENGYSWWMNRLKTALLTYDYVRIDHFRSFSAYWSIPASEPTAKNGRWVSGPGIDFFNALNNCFPNPNIIAEDLGLQDVALTELLYQTGFPGMRIMEFAFMDNNDNIHLPHNYKPNMVVYSGTHDNNTLLGTLFEYSIAQRTYAFDYCGYNDQWENQWQIGGYHSLSCRAFIHTLWQSVANLVILPIQDICGFGNDTRMNKPGTINNNWLFRMTRDGLSQIDIDWMKQMNSIYKRTI